ncbi:unnamed protein product, partial [Rotaria sp. Silwood2]
MYCAAMPRHENGIA